MNFDLAERVSEIQRSMRAERGKVYGDPLENHRGIASMWTPLLQPHIDKLSRGEPIPAWTVALMMAVLKIDRCRIRYHADNYVDLLIYLAFADEWQRAEADQDADRGSKGCIRTYTGIAFNLKNPTKEMFEVRDIAWALSHLCRFTGHCSRFYSVAEHSIYVSRLLPMEFKLWGLLHDATEAYIGDCSSPLKAYLKDFREIEHGIARGVSDAFGLVWPMPSEVHAVDSAMLAAEASALHLDMSGVATLPAPPDGLVIPNIRDTSCSDDAEEFVWRFTQLVGGVNPDAD